MSSISQQSPINMNGVVRIPLTGTFINPLIGVNHTFLHAFPTAIDFPLEGDSMSLYIATAEDGAPIYRWDGNTEGYIITGASGPRGEKGDIGDPFLYADFTPEQLAQLTGPKGDIGDTGTTGPQGAEGPQGLTGEQGIAGPQGIQGLTGARGDTGNAFIYSDFTTEQLSQLTGPKGEIGDTGATGLQGAEGHPGVSGADGSNGVDGIDGLSPYAVAVAGGYLGTSSEFNNLLSSIGDIATLLDVINGEVV